MPPEIRFLSVRLRAIAQATELEQRVLRAIILASGKDDIAPSRSEGHFGNPITVFETELKKAAEIRAFVRIMADAGVLAKLRGHEDARIDEGCNFHYRLDKQKASLGKLELASGSDVIDVRIKIGVYPAKRDESVRVLAEWLAEMPG